MHVQLVIVFISGVVALASAQPTHSRRKYWHRGRDPFPAATAVDLINSMNTTWRAASHPLIDVRGKAWSGVLPGAAKRKPGVSIRAVPANIPPFFDAREAWPDCPSIREIRDQSNCGSCWAFATVEAITDRICIASQQQLHVQISAQELLSCCSDCGHGCHGGYPGSAWDFYVNDGLVSGGLFNGTGCQPYSIEPHHHGENYTDTPDCERFCVDGRTVTSDKHYGLSAYSLVGVEQIQVDIMQNGPVGADFSLYSDFPLYKSGVYQRHSPDYVTGHAVKLIGWGEEAGVPFWIAANSWNTEWGEAGFFRFLRGSNECGIEAAVMAGIPDVG